MHRDVIQLVRRPLLVLGQSFVVDEMSAREPHKADRLTNAVRRMDDLFSGRRFDRSGYNRKQRGLYQKRVTPGQRKIRPGQEFTGKKRTAPDKRVGMRLRQR